MPGRLAIIAEFKCPQCGGRFRACACESSGWIVTCPHGHAVLADGSTRADAPARNLTDNRVFTGTETLSRTWGFHPDEVGEVRQMLGAVGNCINADGDVNFGSRAEEKAFRRRYVGVRAANESRVRESGQAHGEHGGGDE